MPKVTVYSTPTCPYCKQAKEYLKQNNIAYTEIDVATDAKAAEAMIKKSGQMGVPVIAIDDKVIVGFDKAELAAALGIK